MMRWEDSLDRKKQQPSTQTPSKLEITRHDADIYCKRVWTAHAVKTISEIQLFDEEAQYILSLKGGGEKNEHNRRLLMWCTTHVQSFHVAYIPQYVTELLLLFSVHPCIHKLIMVAMMCFVYSFPVHFIIYNMGIGWLLSTIILHYRYYF